MSSWKIHFPQIKLTIQRFFLLEKISEAPISISWLTDCFRFESAYSYERFDLHDAILRSTIYHDRCWLLAANSLHPQGASINYREQLATDRTTDSSKHSTSHRKNRKLVSPWWFVVSFGLLLLLTFVLHNQGMESLTWILFITCGLTLALFVVGWWAIGRLPVRALTDDQTINRQYNDLTKFYWSAFMVTTSFFVNLVIYLPLLTVNLSNRFFEVLMISEFLLIFLFAHLPSGGCSGYETSRINC